MSWYTPDHCRKVIEGFGRADEQVILIDKDYEDTIRKLWS